MRGSYNDGGSSDNSDPDERSPSQVKSEIIAQKMLKKLLVNRSFQKYLVDSTVKKILNDPDPTGTTTTNNNNNGQKFTAQKFGFNSPTSTYRCAVIYEKIDLLICHLKLITESFIKSSNLAFCDIGANVNRDAALLFSVRLQLEQFLNCNQFQLLRFEQFIRRLYTLLRCFATRISTPFQIANCAFFASCLCDLLYRFEEFCSIHEKNYAIKFKQLHKAISIFHDIVVRRLNEMVTARIKEESTTKKVAKLKTCEISPLQYTPHRPKSAATFHEVEKTLRSPGYLLPHELRVRRRSMLSRRATASFSPAKERFSKHMSQKNIQGEAVHRLARELTEEMVNDLATRVDDVILISK
uniref:Nucleolus and neural progenitor protein-like N-terminal domain-containing protein n=1 Tax=Setaria digitata TaxID=48799 RepID=A0A915PC73_9BILA